MDWTTDSRSGAVDCCFEQGRSNEVSNFVKYM
jgi:hypothetical protein